MSPGALLAIALVTAITAGIAAVWLAYELNQFAIMQG
jgi:hypothetical protein